MRCENVANEIRDRLNISEKYVVGDILVARTWIKQPRVNINLRYRITKIEDDELGKQMTLQNMARQVDEFMLFEPIVDKTKYLSLLCYLSFKSGVKRKGKHNYSRMGLTHNQQRVDMDGINSLC